MKPGIIGTYHQHLGENGRILGLILDALPNKYLGVSFPIRIYRISFNFCLYNYVLTFYIYIYIYILQKDHFYPSPSFTQKFGTLKAQIGRHQQGSSEGAGNLGA